MLPLPLRISYGGEMPQVAVGGDRPRMQDRAREPFTSSPPPVYQLYNVVQAVTQLEIHPLIP